MRALYVYFSARPLYDKVCFSISNYINSPSFHSSHYFNIPSKYLQSLHESGDLKNDFKNDRCDTFKTLYQLAASVYCVTLT